MPRNTEPRVNAALGELLSELMGPWTVRTENTQVLAENRSWHPDILVSKDDRAPVVIEAEFDPGSGVESDANARLGATEVESGKPVEAVIAVRYPEAVHEAEDVRDELTSSPLSYCTFATGEPRFPESGWLTGSVEDLSDTIRLVSVPQSIVEEAVATLERGIDLAEPALRGVVATKPFIGEWIAELLGMENSLQTRRMACAIIVNAMVFHHKLAGSVDSIDHLPDLKVVPPPPFRTVERAWREILKVNYWPIFGIAADIVAKVPGYECTPLLQRLQVTADAVIALGIDNSHDLTGRVFQRLIVDRKYLATYYTSPASAALLAQLAVSKMDDVGWSDIDSLASLRVADFACGTGALLAAVYEQFARRHERAGGEAAGLHKVMLEEVLYGCDVMPSAIHITGSTLSGMEPSVRFDRTQLYTLAYGRQDDGSVAIGSLELLQSSAAMSLFNTSDPAERTGGQGQETAARITTDIRDGEFDLVIMNPPFTRSTNHEGPHASVVNPAFAAFGASADDQSEMGGRLRELGRTNCYHGNAGLASAFAALAHKKLKPGGILAMVLPLSATAGLSWSKFRHMLCSKYSDVDIVSIAGQDGPLSFSADTSLAECLIVGRKAIPAVDGGNRLHFISLRGRPSDMSRSNEIARSLVAGGDPRRVEDGPYGGTPISIADEHMGERVTSACETNGEVWSPTRIIDFSVAQSCEALKRSELRLPGLAEWFSMPTVALGDLGSLGYVHRDIIDPPPRGAFDKAQASRTATFPSLWNHHAELERRMVVAPDSQLIARRGMESKAHSIWATAGRAHTCLDFGFGSGSLSVAMTEFPTIGGRAWPNVNFENAQFDLAFAIWSNSTLGLLNFWWHANRQMPGRGTTTIRSVGNLPVLDLRTLTDAQLQTAADVFDDFRNRDFRPAYLADVDDNRALLDRRVVCDLLGFDERVYDHVRALTAKWCAEPSVHGGKGR